MYLYKLVTSCAVLFFALPDMRTVIFLCDRLCGLVVRVLGYRSGGPGSIPGTTRKEKCSGYGTGSIKIVGTTDELLDRKVEAPV
jgi:hypothetical protein